MTAVECFLYNALRILPDLCYNKLQVCLQEVAMFAVNVAINYR